MGGHDAGEVASALAVETLAALVDVAGKEADFHQLLELTNAKIFEAMYAGPGKPGMGTTIVGMQLADSEAYVFNLGDSRAYTFERGKLIQWSHDDTLERGASRTRSHRHALTQALGGTLAHQPIQAHVAKVRLTSNTLLVLCSDGLTDMLSDVEIADILARDITSPAEELIHAALSSGGDDNVTAIVIGGVRCDCQPV